MFVSFSFLKFCTPFSLSGLRRFVLPVNRISSTEIEFSSIVVAAAAAAAAVLLGNGNPPIQLK